MKHKLAISATLATAVAVTFFALAAVSLSNRTMAADGGRGDRVAVTDDECKAATWPNIPEICLQRVDPRGPVGNDGAFGARAG